MNGRRGGDAREGKGALYDSDLADTILNRARIAANPNLAHWYASLHHEMLASHPPNAGLHLLEIGSGVSPLKRERPDILASDVLALDHLDLVFDAHDIDRLEAIADGGLDAVVMTNVLHHLADPLAFLLAAAVKLKPGGAVIMAEPYFSALSTPIYKLIHHEPADFNVATPKLAEVRGPLSSANQAIPHLLFVSRRQWLEPLRALYDIDRVVLRPFTAVSYFASGGLRRRLPIPPSVYRALFTMDAFLARAAPRLFASFAIFTLTRRPEAAAREGGVNRS